MLLILRINAPKKFFIAHPFCAIFQQKTNPIFREKDPRYLISKTSESDSTKTSSAIDSGGDTWDLVDAGGVLMRELASRNSQRNSQRKEFKFKPTNQLIFTSTVLQTDRLIFALQAPTAF